MKQTIKLNEYQLKDIIENVISESVDEGFLGNMFKAGGQQIANKASRAYNDFSQRFNTMNAQDASQQADAMDREVESLPLQIKAQVKQYRSQLMIELNQKVRDYKAKLMTNMQNKQTAATNMRNKANNYQNKANTAGDRLADADQERYNNRGGVGNQERMVAEERLNEAIKSSIRKYLY